MNTFILVHNHEWGSTPYTIKTSADWNRVYYAVASADHDMSADLQHILNATGMNFQPEDGETLSLIDTDNEITVNLEFPE